MVRTFPTNPTMADPYPHRHTHGDDERYEGAGGCLGPEVVGGHFPHQAALPAIADLSGEPCHNTRGFNSRVFAAKYAATHSFSWRTKVTLTFTFVPTTPLGGVGWAMVAYLPVFAGIRWRWSGGEGGFAEQKQRSERVMCCFFRILCRVLQHGIT
jgi:hypothetical protein